MTRPIYLDYMSTTPVDDRVIARMSQYLGYNGDFGNPASITHSYGWTAAGAVEDARNQVADLINAEAEEIIWTSGATEANNLAIKGAARFYHKQGNHIITCLTEHKSVLDVFEQLQHEGFEITYLRPQLDGRIDLNDLEKALRPDTLLLSIAHVNNEIGVIQDIQAISEITRARGILLHVDGAQSAGKITVDVKKILVDLMSFSAHKVYGPKGVGALYIRGKPPLRIEPLFNGGPQERGIRPGTLPTHQIVGMGEAFKIAKQEMDVDSARILQLRQRLWQGLQSQLTSVHLNGSEIHRVAGNLSVGFAGPKDAAALMKELHGIAVSSSSACLANRGEKPSPVLQAIGLSDALARSSIRFSIGRFTTQADIDKAIEEVVKAVL
jgi:cysteine desulfurase